MPPAHAASRRKTLLRKCTLKVAGGGPCCLGRYSMCMLSERSSGFPGRPCWAQYRPTAGQKQRTNHSWKRLTVTHAFLCHCRSTGRLGLEEPSSAHGFSEGYSSSGFSLKLPAALPPSSRVRSRAALNRGRLVLCGQERPVGQSLPEQPHLIHTEHLPGRVAALLDDPAQQRRVLARRLRVGPWCLAAHPRPCRPRRALKWANHP